MAFGARPMPFIAPPRDIFTLAVPSTPPKVAPKTPPVREFVIACDGCGASSKAVGTVGQCQYCGKWHEAPR